MRRKSRQAKRQRERDELELGQRVTASTIVLAGQEQPVIESPREHSVVESSSPTFFQTLDTPTDYYSCKRDARHTESSS